MNKIVITLLIGLMASAAEAKHLLCLGSANITGRAAPIAILLKEPVSSGVNLFRSSYTLYFSTKSVLRSPSFKLDLNEWEELESGTVMYRELNVTATSKEIALDGGRAGNMSILLKQVNNELVGQSSGYLFLSLEEDKLSLKCSYIDKAPTY